MLYCIQTNAYKLFLLPITLVRFATDPVADVAVSLISKLKAIVIARRGQEATVEESVKWSEWLRQQIKEWGLFAYAKLRGAKEEVRPMSYTEVMSSHISKYGEATKLSIREAAETIKTGWASLGTEDSDSDRVLTVLLGYATLLLAAGLYLRYTSNITARNATRAFHDVLKQQFVLFKAAAFFIVEIVLFPTLCGVLINLATIPLIPGVTVQSRVNYAITNPLSSGFLTWLAGTNFMYAFATWIAVVRKSIRKGVLWFIRDPSDPEVRHPSCACSESR